MLGVQLHFNGFQTVKKDDFQQRTLIIQQHQAFQHIV